MRFRRAGGAPALPLRNATPTRGRAPAAVSPAFGPAPPLSREQNLEGGDEGRRQLGQDARDPGGVEPAGEGRGIGRERLLCEGVFERGERSRSVSAGNHQGCHQQSRSALRGAVCGGQALGIFAPGPESVVQAEGLRFDGMRESANCGTVPSI